MVIFSSTSSLSRCITFSRAKGRSSRNQTDGHTTYFFSCLGLCLVPLTYFNSISHLIHPFMSHWNPFLDSGDIQFFPLSFSLSKEIFHLSPWLWESNENLTCQMCCCCCSCCSVSGVFPPHSRAYPTERSCLGVGNWPKHKWVTPQC